MREDNDPLGHHLGNEDLLLAVESYAEDFCLATILMFARFGRLHSIYFNVLRLWRLNFCLGLNKEILRLRGFSFYFSSFISRVAI